MNSVGSCNGGLTRAISKFWKMHSSNLSQIALPDKWLLG